MKRNYLLIFGFILCSIGTQAQVKNNKNKETKGVSIIDNTRPYSGYFDFYYSPKSDKIYLKVSNTEEEFLYVNSLSQGIGNNDIGLDRGQLGNERVVYFSKAGNKLLLIQPNLRYRSSSENPLEQRSIKEAFAKSVLFGFPIVEEQEGKYIIDLTPFLLQDAHGVAQRLRQTNQGTFSIDKTRSAINLDRTKAFPLNIEFDMLLTFTGEAKGRWLQSVTPTPDAVTVFQ